MSVRSSAPFTGRRMAAILVGFFGVVIAVNLLMASIARGTFGGVVVRNSYVASEQFNRWLDEGEAERALGWKAQVARRPDDRLAVVMTGLPEGPNSLTAVARHPLGREADRLLDFSQADPGRFVSDQTLPGGRWRLRLEAQAGGRQWRHEEDVR